jgi:hypothetical protein
MNWPELVLNAVFKEPGPIVFKYACRLGCEGIVSKRRGPRIHRAGPDDFDVIYDGGEIVGRI